jgi:hypothetical protein
MTFFEGLRLRVRARHLARISLAGAVLVLLSGLFSSIQVGCLLPETYVCGTKNSFDQCFSFTQLTDCQMHPICEWRVGCASGCRHATTDLECAQHHGCSVIGSPHRCFSYGCALTTGIDATSEEECSKTTDCNWEPSCWDAPNTDCDVKLDETECKRRNCVWKKEDSSL